MNIEEIAIKALKASFAAHNALGESGKDELQKNQFGDMAMRGDYEAEEAVISVLRDQKLPVVVHSEEHGLVRFVENPTLLGVLDGIDGSSWYKSNWGVGRYGTMLGIYEGANPQYKDYIFGGIMEHASKRLYYGTKDGGAWIMNIETQERTPIHVSRTSKMNKTINIHVDQYWDVNQKIFMSKLHGYNVMDYKRCSSFHYTDMSMGTADLTLECTRKGSLEIATAYPLITEAGGVMVSLDGDSLADKYYLKFGVDEYVPVITAATSELAHESVDFFK